MGRYTGEISDRTDKNIKYNQVARFFVHSRNGKKHRIFGDDIAWCKADGIRNDNYIIKLGAIVLAVEKGDESLDIRAEW